MKASHSSSSTNLLLPSAPSGATFFLPRGGREPSRSRCYPAPVDAIASLTPGLGPDPLSALAEPPSGASMVEVRLDMFPGLDLAAAVSSSRLPVLATLRSAAEGGEGPNDPTLRREILRRARDAGAALLDLEADRDLELLSSLGLEPERVVLSWHDPVSTPPDLERVAERLMSTSARWVKVVSTARSVRDLSSVLGLHRVFNRGKQEKRRLLTFAMGHVGLASRYLSPLLGPPLTYVAWPGSTAAAPGQLTLSQLEHVVGHLRGAPQRLYGVIGVDVAHSLSPALHSAGYVHFGLPFAFLPISVPDPAELELVFQPVGETCFDRLGLPVHGWAVTAPYKGRAAEAATRSAPRVQTAWAANTLLLRKDQILADNTDADGVVGALLAAGVQPQGRPALIQGTGGAARGAAVGLHLAGAQVAVRGRDDNRTRSTAKALGVGWLAPGTSPPEDGILVNATPLGTSTGDVLPFAKEEVDRAAVVVDFVYGEGTPTLAAFASLSGIPYIDGREVLLYQGIAQFAAMTGQVVPSQVMRRGLT